MFWQSFSHFLWSPRRCHAHTMPLHCSMVITKSHRAPTERSRRGPSLFSGVTVVLLHPGPRELLSPIPRCVLPSITALPPRLRPCGPCPCCPPISNSSMLVFVPLQYDPSPRLEPSLDMKTHVHTLAIPALASDFALIRDVHPIVLLIMCFLPMGQFHIS